MTILKTIDGDEIDTDKIPQGFGAFTQYVQQNYDKNWGKGTEKKSKYDVELSATKTVPVSYTITVEAETEKQAKEKALEEARTVSDWDWYENDCRIEIDDIEIESIEESEDDDE